MNQCHNHVRLVNCITAAVSVTITTWLCVFLIRYYLLDSEGYAIYTSDDARNKTSAMEKRHFFYIRPKLSAYLVDEMVFLSATCTDLDGKLLRRCYKVNAVFGGNFAAADVFTYLLCISQLARAWHVAK